MSSPDHFEFGISSDGKKPAVDAAEGVGERKQHTAIGKYGCH